MPRRSPEFSEQNIRSFESVKSRASWQYFLASWAKKTMSRESVATTPIAS